MERLFVTGGSGLLGSKFRDGEYDIIKTHHQNPSKESILLDISSKEDVKKKIISVSPDVVIHTAALTDVDYCEDHHQEAWKINAKGTENIVKACEKIDCKLIYVSTDFVFDGERGNYTEKDETNPLNYYALTKLKGEEFVRNSNLDYAIARVSVLYGWHEKLNFVTWVIGELKKNKRINIVTDQYNSPTLADNAAEALMRIYEKDKSGTYHVAGDERISRFHFAENITEIFDLDEDLINPIKSDELIQRARRPRDTSLSVEKAKMDLKIKLLNTKEGLEEMMKGY